MADVVLESGKPFGRSGDRSCRYGADYLGGSPLSSEQAFAEALIAAMDRGRRTGTHKLLLLLALLEEVPLAFDAISGRPPRSLSLRRIAHRVLDHSLRHASDYPSATHEAWPLKQASTGTSRFIRAAGVAREQVGLYDAKGSSADALQRQDEVSYERAIRTVIDTLVDNPLPRLQGDIGDEFLYAWPLEPQPTRDEFRETVGYDGELHLHEGAASDLVRLTPLLRPLIESHYLRAIASFNQDVGIEDLRVAEYLFGSERGSIGKDARAALRERDGRYCPYERELGRPPRESRVIDHFLPWSRLRSNRTELLTWSCGSCNAAKSDHLPAPRHVVAFIERAKPVSGHPPGDLDAAMSLIASTYSAVPLGSPMWLHRAESGNEFVKFDPEGRNTIFAAMQRRHEH